MSYRFLRATALSSAIVISSLPGAACSGGNEGAAADGRTTPNVNQAATATDAAGGNTSASAGAQQIEMGDDVFLPAVVTIPAGTRVTWVNKGSKAHTVVSNDKSFDSGLLNVGAEFSHTYSAPGSYPYHCAPHAKMVGQIIVR
jgi:plastocyanin